MHQDEYLEKKIIFQAKKMKELNLICLRICVSFSSSLPDPRVSKINPEKRKNFAAEVSNV